MENDRIIVQNKRPLFSKGAEHSQRGGASGVKGKKKMKTEYPTTFIDNLAEVIYYQNLQLLTAVSDKYGFEKSEFLNQILYIIINIFYIFFICN